MDWTTCKRCGTDVGADAAVCPRCGADPRSGRGGPARRSGPRVAPGWHRLLKYLAIAAGVGVVFVILLRALGGVVASSTGWNTWYEGIVAFVACLAIIAGVGIASGAGVRVRAYRGREAPADPFVGLSVLACGLVVLVLGFAVVPGPTASLSKGAVDAGANPNPHWAGYETSTAVRSVAASWTEPAIAPSAGGETDASFWVGLGGQNNPRLAQLGTDAADQAGQSPVYTAWYEMYPKPAYALDPTALSVHAGDRLSASVTEVSGGRFRLVIVNHTTHQHFAIAQTDLGIPTTDGAIIAELPTAPYQLSLASFGTVRFTDCAVNGRPLDDDSLSMFEIYRHGMTEARTSALGADGASFTVSRQTVVLSPSPTITPTVSGGIQGLAGVLNPTGTPAPVPATSDTMSSAAYRHAVARDRTMLLEDLARIAHAGAGGVISDAAYARFSDDSETASIDAETDFPPDSLASLGSRWNAVIDLATLFGQPGSGVVLDLRGARKPTEALLTALEGVHVGDGAGIVRQIAADLQRGLWVRKAYRVPLVSYGTISYGVLDRRAGTLAGRRYVFVGEVAEIQDAGKGYYLTGFPHRLKPEVWMDVEVTHRGLTDYGDATWDNDVSVIFDTALHHIHKNDIVVLYGTCVGWDRSAHNGKVPLIRASVVKRVGHSPTSSS